MNPQTIFGMQIVLSVIAWALVIRVAFLPKLKSMTRYEVLVWLTLPHIFRHIGMVFLVPGVVTDPLRPTFANAAAFGDLLAGVLAMIAIISLLAKRPRAILIVWVFNVLGTFDLINALRNPDVIPSLGAAWFIPTFIVPLLLLTHFLIFKELIRKKHRHPSQQ